ncbi:helix-turn-helix domain-containing protein [Acinetobacter pittii]|uniref:helix-turn-helix domain-containing protein n=1 Tax=Acinetobacter TaxID=469 RepID=UPI0003B8643F|nr:MULTISPECIES: helix-turn-helix domain-containing protein [Acinetobacter]KCY63711.1 helix-turn-helix domain protein [Acinetobacter baumannii 1288284]EKU6417283.1 helix-turn-helix domain-containing protein [Acinetobacter baumannii]EKW4834652.1 helix-turn-helix domain-containing protein [Acinetobacter baumannii]EKX1716916.1 helix-turn-helix domain-containing protein [Acinetobacter baumannii]EKX3088525.1 helix-turn-helix domain-containing protein [Acinetobacter baumannii]
MSIDATRWAWAAPVNNSSQRLVLLSLADRAGEEHTAWPSIERLAKDTVLDKKTVQKVILELIKLGLVEDTGERTGPTRRVRVLKLNGVKGREEYTQNLDDANTPKNGNIKQSQKRNDSKNGNDPKNSALNNPKNGMLNDPKNGVQNPSGNLPMNLSQEHDWIPDVDQLITKIKMAGHSNNIDLIFGLPSFEFELSAFNSYFDNSGLSDSKKLHKFTAWIVDKFERYKKQNPEYGIQSLTGQQANTAQPFLNLPTKPKSLLGGPQ